MLSLSMGKSSFGRGAWRRSAAFVFLPALILLFVGLFLLFGSLGASAAPEAENHPGRLEFRDYDYPRSQLDNPMVSWFVVNKQRPIFPLEFEPHVLATPSSSASLDNSRQIRLAPGAAAAVSRLAEAMSTELGAKLVLHSGFRTYSYQQDLFAAKIRQYGEELALIRSAQAGHSEHQTGLAVDVSALGYGCVIEQCFGETEPGKWLAQNSWRYGFIVRYLEGATAVTGYDYEPWHLRFLGVHLATEFHFSGARTLEEFWGLPPAPNYFEEPITESTNP
jgi:D-alanyl-D-alanine carboxypeptidase